jgi:UDP-N-acetylmuramyl tripeptide synthase
MNETEIFDRMRQISEAIDAMSRERDGLILQLKGHKSSRRVAEFCGRSHAYVCKIWKESSDV